jgi:hypothetical protein
MSNNKKDTPPCSPVVIAVDGKKIGKATSWTPIDPSTAEKTAFVKDYQPGKEVSVDARVAELWNKEIETQLEGPQEEVALRLLPGEDSTFTVTWPDGREETVVESWWEGRNLVLKMENGRVWSLCNARFVDVQDEGREVDGVVTENFQFNYTSRGKGSCQ